jgi:putative hydrolase of the HAD superfamily
MKAIAFDLGDTLVEYEGVPLSWEAHYPEALGDLAAFLGLTPDSDQLDQACAVLRRYNTRIHPREEEVSFAVILGELMKSLGATVEADEVACAMSFFRIFRQRLRCFPDARAAVDALRRKSLKVGIFTDVPYGMPSRLVLEDVSGAGLADSFDVLMTSRDAGFRKPSIATLASLARMLDCSAHEMAYVGNERKDVEVALAFGCHSILINRGHHGSDWGQHRTIASLSEL